MVVADVVRDYAQTVLLPTEAANGTKLEHYFRPLLDRAKKDLRREGFSSIRAERFADMRYLGQSFEITVSIPKGGNFSGKLLSRFHEMHDSQFWDIQSPKARRGSYLARPSCRKSKEAPPFQNREWKEEI